MEKNSDRSWLLMSLKDITRQTKWVTDEYQWTSLERFGDGNFDIGIALRN